MPEMPEFAQHLSLANHRAIMDEWQMADTYDRIADYLDEGDFSRTGFECRSMASYLRRRVASQIVDIVGKQEWED